MIVKIGKIVNTQGIKGEVRVLSNSDFKEERFSDGTRLKIKLKDEYISLDIEKHKYHKNFVILKFYQYNNINEVLYLKNSTIYGEKMKSEDLDEGYMFDDLVGMTIANEEETKGKVVEVIDNPGHDLLKVAYMDKFYFIPFVESFISNVDLELKTIEVKLIDGIIDED